MVGEARTTESRHRGDVRGQGWKGLREEQPGHRHTAHPGHCCSLQCALQEYCSNPRARVAWGDTWLPRAVEDETDLSTAPSTQPWGSAAVTLDKGLSLSKTHFPLL